MKTKAKVTAVLSTLFLAGAVLQKSPPRELRPSAVADYAKTAVKIMSKEKDSGGSGVILSSSPVGSVILTNKHVCELIQSGGYADNLEVEYNVRAYKVYPSHDLCLVGINENLGVNTKVASKEPDMFSESLVSGHPSLLPMILSPGHFSGKERVSIMVDMKQCKGTETGLEQRYCHILGGIPVTRIYDAQIVSSLIMPGSSGSGVFNKNGEISGLIFAGSSGLGYGSIVPWKFVKDFVDSSDSFPWVEATSQAKPKKFMKILFRAMDLCEQRDPQVITLCNEVKFQSIWRKKTNAP
jgi:S1-C subfamily serine protease